MSRKSLLFVMSGHSIYPLTDKNGEWSINGPRGTRSTFLQGLYRCFTILGGYYTMPPQFIIFKPGYCSWPKGFEINACKEKIKPAGSNKIIDGETAELPKLMKREDRLRNSSIWPSLMESDKESLAKIRNLLNLINQEEQEQGLPPDPRLKEIENEK